MNKIAHYSIGVIIGLLFGGSIGVTLGYVLSRSLGAIG